MQDWLAWLVVAAACGVAEMLTLGLVLGMMAVAAVVSALVAAAGGGVTTQVVAFVLATPLLLGVLRPVARRHLMRAPGEVRTGVDALIGQQALVLEEVGPHSGRVRIGGEVWSARSYDGRAVMPAGATVDVLSIEGATALVHPSDQELTWQV